MRRPIESEFHKAISSEPESTPEERKKNLLEQHQLKKRFSSNPFYMKKDQVFWGTFRCSRGDVPIKKHDL